MEEENILLKETTTPPDVSKLDTAEKAQAKEFLLNEKTRKQQQLLEKQDQLQSISSLIDENQSTLLALGTNKEQYTEQVSKLTSNVKSILPAGTVEVFKNPSFEQRVSEYENMVAETQKNNLTNEVKTLQEEISNIDLTLSELE